MAFDIFLKSGFVTRSSRVKVLRKNDSRDAKNPLENLQTFPNALYLNKVNYCFSIAALRDIILCSLSRSNLIRLSKE